MRRFKDLRIYHRKTLNYKKFIKITTISFVLMIFSFSYLNSQTFNSSPANWLFPDGNPQATKYVETPSISQSVDSFMVKWSTPYISGDVKPLIGNLVNNQRIFSALPFAPNEMTAYVADTLYIIDGLGKVISRTGLANSAVGVKGVSVLFDTNAVNVQNGQNTPLVMGLETMEYQPPDTIAHAYIAGYQNTLDSVLILNRLAIDLRPFAPNTYASIKPVLGRRANEDILIYAIVNTSQPTIPANYDPDFDPAPFFRGFAQFNTGEILSSFPLPDIGDDTDSRVTVGPEVSVAQPSYIVDDLGESLMLLPTFPTSSLGDVDVYNFVTSQTSISRPYIIGLNLTEPFVLEQFPPQDYSALVDINARPQIRSYFVDIQDEATGDRGFILAAEEYSGIEGSTGTSVLHLHDRDGFPLTTPSSFTAPPFLGGENHFWSVAVGNVDGDSANTWEPFYPNNPGNEIIVTQSSRDFTVAGSRLFVLRYYTGTAIEKPTGANEFLFELDTIFSQKINGWVAAVNDLDGNSDGKDEIILVDGSKLLIMGAKNYFDQDFRFGTPLDTLYIHDFNKQTISNVAVADLEGDGRNDVIVTTYDSTYVLGNIIPNTLEILYPRQDNAIAREYCAGDTVELNWVNKVSGEDYVNIYLRPFENGILRPDMDTLIVENYFNNVDTNTYAYMIDEYVMGRSGQLIVRGINNPNIILDSATIMTFYAPEIYPEAPDDLLYYVGSPIDLTGSSFCVDSVTVQYMELDSTWTSIVTESVEPDGTYSFEAETPCPEGFFECFDNDSNNILNLRLIGRKSVFGDTSGIYDLAIAPTPFPVEWEEPQTASPDISFMWDEMDVPEDCGDSVNVLLSINGGETYGYITTLSIQEEMYKWQIPLNLPDSVSMRFCCTGSCVRTDTTIYGYKPNYINIVAPNPFRPPLEEVEVVYYVPRDLNVTIRIMDQANRVVTTLVKDSPRVTNLSYTERWDGRLDDGTLAANGMYYIVMELSDGARQVHPLFIRK
jgi:hypothetical protein